MLSDDFVSFFFPQMCLNFCIWFSGFSIKDFFCFFYTKGSSKDSAGERSVFCIRYFSKFIWNHMQKFRHFWGKKTNTKSSPSMVLHSPLQLWICACVTVTENVKERTSMNSAFFRKSSSPSASFEPKRRLPWKTLSPWEELSAFQIVTEFFPLTMSQLPKR